MDRQRKSQHELAALDNSLREVRGVSLQQPLDETMMGGTSMISMSKQAGQPDRNNDLASAVNASSSEHDPQSLTQGGATGPVGGFKLPNITRGSGFSQSGHDGIQGGIGTYGLGTVTAGSHNLNVLATQGAGQSATTHHLNVTVGDDKFYYSSAHDPANQANGTGKLPTISNHSGTSLRLKSHHLGNEYQGLIDASIIKKSKQGTSVEFVQTGFQVGQATRKPINLDSTEMNQMMTIDADASQKLQTVGPSETTHFNRPRLGSQSSIKYGQHQSSGRNVTQLQTLHMTSNNSGADYMKHRIPAVSIESEGPLARAGGTVGASNSFENYIGRVITSVQHRKKNPRLKSLFGGTASQRTGSIDYSRPDVNDYAGSQDEFGSMRPGHQRHMTMNVDDLSARQGVSLGGRPPREGAGSAVVPATRMIGGPGAATTQPTSPSEPDPKKNLQVSLLGNKHVVQKDVKATEQVAYLLRQIQKKGPQVFLPLERVKDPNSHLMFRENKKPPEDHAGMVVFSKNGFVSLARDKNGQTDFISNEEFIEDGVTHQILKDIPFFKKFNALRTFMRWKNIMRVNAYEAKRQKLAENFLFARPIFADRFRKLVPSMNAIASLKLIEIQPSVTYGKKQPQTLEGKCEQTLTENKKVMESLLTSVKAFMVELKEDIEEDDRRFENAIKDSQEDELLRNMYIHQKPVNKFHTERLKQEAVEEQYRLKRMRHVYYDELLQLVFRYWSYKVLELLFDSKRQFREIFCEPKMTTQFEISVCFGPDDKLDSNPTMDEHLTSFRKVFEEMEQAVFKNQFLQFFMHDLNDLFFAGPNLYTRQIFSVMQKIKRANDAYARDHELIFTTLDRDVNETRRIIESYKSLQQIQEVCNEWKTGGKGQSVEMNTYQSTYKKMEEFKRRIAQVPSQAMRQGTILIETNSLKKQLAAMPAQVLDSIQQNMQETMMQETKTLKEDLTKITEILTPLPTSLNTYVEQSNTLKYCEHKREYFQGQFETIQDLYQQCKQDGTTKVIGAIEEVEKLWTGLPELEKQSAEQLAEYKDTMEQIMSSSSNMLSKKIQAFQKKYVEAYLQDESRLADCGDTLEELFKRSKAIHEIRSKVILYREFLKLLYEKDENPKEKMEKNKLSCAEDFEKLSEIHKHTIRLWKILLYWKKRRQLCNKMSFLHLDTQQIIKSIHKVTRFLDEKLPQHEYVQAKSRQICKTVQKQVKETSINIEFVKDLRRPSLHARHWMQIFDLIKAPHLKTQATFTIVDLTEYHIRDYEEEIHQIIEHANTEAKYETIFTSICDEWEKLELKIIPFKDTQNSYIMVNTETLSQAIEENLNTLEVVSQSEFAAHIEKDIQAWIVKLKVMHKNLETWVDAQKYWINLDVVYNSGLFSNIFGENTKNFIKTRLQFQRIMWSSYKNPQAIYNLMIETRMEVFREMTKLFQVLQKKVHEFLEEKRLIFSRFFFLNDSQFLEFLTLANTSQDFSMYVNTLFVGAQSLYIQPADHSRLTKHEDGKGLDDKESSSDSSDSDSMLSEDEKRLQVTRGAQSTNKTDKSVVGVENSKMGIEGVNDYQVLGMISQNKELFLFESPVLILNDNPKVKEVEGYEVSGMGTGNVEQWLMNVEKSMQQSMRKQMQYAVKSFATRALDEWLLDYPQQVILTTLNLVLTNEIQDILEEKERAKELAEASDQDDGHKEEVHEEEPSAGEDDENTNNDPKSPGQAKEGEVKSPTEGTTGENRDSQDDVPNMVKKEKEKNETIKLSPDEQRGRLHAELFGEDFKPDERFHRAIEHAKIEIRTRKIQQTQAQIGGGALAAAALKNAKRGQKRADHRDHIMEVLSLQTFFGIYLRLQFWTNKVIRSLTDERKSDPEDKDIDFKLTGVQKIIMRNVVLYLLHQRDVVDRMITLDIHDKNDFEWQSKVRVFWSDKDQPNPLLTSNGPIITCGGWQQELGTEYLGSHKRLPLSPQTDRYMVFLSSALREKSGILLKANTSHTHASDVFEEFAHQCHMAHKALQCNQDMHVSQLMQVINGAAMAKFWVFFEHLDNLPLVNFQIVVKEIQMVQQQYIIAELGDYDVAAETAIMSKGIHIDENRGGAKGDLTINKASNEIFVNKGTALVPSNDLAQKIVSTANRPSLGIFASLSANLTVRCPDVADNLNLQAQSTFRTISLARPDMTLVMEMIMKAEGYSSYKRLALLTTRFVAMFTAKKNEELYGSNAKLEEVERKAERLVLHDLQTAVRLSILLRDQEWSGYLDKYFQNQRKPFELLIDMKKEKAGEAAVTAERRRQRALQAKGKIENESVREGLRMIVKQKFLNEWRAAKQDAADAAKEKLDESEEERRLESLIIKTYNESLKQIEQEEAEAARQAALAAGGAPGPSAEDKNPRKNLRAKRRLTHSTTTELKFATKRQTDEADFAEAIEEAMERVTKALQLQVREKQQYHCLGVIEYMRRQKAVAIVGSVCSGKTQILKMVAQTLGLAYDCIFRTSRINPQTFTKEEFYGPINSFDSQTKQDQDEALKKKSIFQIILDTYQHERLSLPPERRNKFIQSFLIDSDTIDSYFLDSLCQFIQKSNLREREYYDDIEFLLHLSSLGQAHETLIQHLPITLPNGNIVMLPSDLYFFFETESLSNASPQFLAAVGLVITQDNDFDWVDLHKKLKAQYVQRHLEVLDIDHGEKFLKAEFKACEHEFLLPIIKIMEKNEEITQWMLWNPKSLILQFYKLLNSMTYRLAEAKEKNKDAEDPMIFPLSEVRTDAMWSLVLCAFVTSFGVSFNNELRKVFEEIFSGFKKKFNIHVSSSAITRPTIFDLYYDVERLAWEVIQEKLDYKLKLAYYPKLSSLLVPTPNVSLSYFILEQLTYYMKHNPELDKNFRVLGPQGTSKSVILNTFVQRSQEYMDTVTVPMSAYLSFERLRKVIESKYVARRKKRFVPRDENKKIAIIIDDVHLQSNLRLNVIEFMRTWTQSDGYFDVGAGYFKYMQDFMVIMAQNSQYRTEKCQLEGRKPLSNRFLFYTTTQYNDDLPIEKFKPFIQHWLTSKMWSPNKLLQKYYIIITNGILQLLEKVKRSDQMKNSSFSQLYSFDILAKFCSSLVLNTVISDDAKEIGVKGQREEDTMANVVLYEVLRNYADRIYKPADRQLFINKAVEIFRHEFQMKEAQVDYIDRLIIGNYHERQVSSYIRYANNTDKLDRVKDMLIQKIAEKTNNHFLASVLDTPNGVRDVFRLSRVLFKEQQHLIMCGSASSSKHELLQVATLLNDVVMLELNAPKFNEPTKFAEAFKQALLTVVRLDDTNAFILINDEQLRDPAYIDYIYNYISFIGKDEDCILMDEDFREKCIAVEVELFMKNKDNFKYDKNKKPNLSLCLDKAVEKLMRHVHIVFMINDLQTYHEWMSLFPGLETKCDVMFVDDLSKEGYKQLTRTFLERAKIDEDMEENERVSVVKSIVFAKDKIRDRIFENFYTQAAMRNYTNEEYMNGQGMEAIFPNEKKTHFYLFDDGNFKVYDPLLKQMNYNMRAELNLVQKGRYIMYLEVFRFLYDFLSLSLSIRKNYYQTFIQKTQQFSDFFHEINAKKKDLHSASNNINFKVAMIQDKMNRIETSIQDKSKAIHKRQKEIEDLQLQLRNHMQEVDQVLEDKNIALADVIEQISKLRDREVSNVAVNSTNMSKNEQTLLAIVAMLIEKDDRVDEFDQGHHSALFVNAEELANLLEDRARFNYDDACFRKLKEFISKFTQSDFTKPNAIKLLFQYTYDLFRKLNVRNTMHTQFQQIAQIKQSIESNKFSINYSEHYIRDRQIEMRVLEDKIKRVKQRDGKLSKKIEVAEISHMRTQHIFESVRDYGNKIQNKLDSINSRMQALVGDCIILAASICFLGFFSSHERIEIRSDIVKHISDVENITCSKDWLLDSGKANPNPKIQTKMFKAILKEFGLRNLLLPHQRSGIITESTLCETLFHLCFAPSCPLVVDPTGEVQDFVRNKLVSKLHVRQVYGSDLAINQHLAGVLRSQTNFALLNDLNTFEKASFGLTQDQSLLHRLCQTFYNGIDFNYERSVIWKKVPNIEQHLFSSFNSLNKKIPVNEPGLENVSMYQVQAFTPSFDYQNGSLFMSKGSSFVAMSNNEDIMDNQDGVTAWMEIKELLLEQVNNHEYKQLQEIKEQIKFYDENKSQLSRAYENAFLIANHDTLQNLDDYSTLKQSIEDIQNQAEERILYKRMYSEMIKKYELLTYYSKIILNMYLSLKVLSKVMNEVTYSWRMFKLILKQVLQQAIRSLAKDAMETKVKAHARKEQAAANKNQKAVNRSPLLSKPQVDIDLRFFQRNLIPKLHKTLMTSVRQDASAPLFNLIFSLRVGLLQERISTKENTYFFKWLLKLPDFQDWRKTELDFISMKDKIEKSRLLQIKRDLLKMYPEFGKKFMEKLEEDIGQEFAYSEASIKIFKLFKDPEFEHLSLMQQICLGFICPDHEFKSRLTQFVYETLSDVFDFSEEYSRLHQLLSRASWKQPIALISAPHVNMINTISSIAQHYGMGLDVIRTDQDCDKLIAESKTGLNQRVDNLIKQNLMDHAAHAMQTREQKYAKLQTMATDYIKRGNVCSDVHATISKLNYVQNSLRQQFDNPDKKLSEMREEDPIRLIERSARTGSWVLISTIRFPQFWKRACQRVEQLAAEGKVDDQFRLIFDFQGYAQNDISDAFLFDHSVVFHMTEQNVEEFQGYDDIWTAILDERVLLKLGEKIDQMRERIKEEGGKFNLGEDSISQGSSARFDRRAGATAPSNFKLIDTTIKSDVQRDLYKQFMKESKQEHAGLKFDLVKAQEPTSEVVSQESSKGDVEEDVDEVPEYSKSMKSLNRDNVSEQLAQKSKDKEDNKEHHESKISEPQPDGKLQLIEVNEESKHAETVPTQALDSARPTAAVGSELEISTADQVREPLNLKIDTMGHGLLQKSEEKKDESHEALTATARKGGPTAADGFGAQADASSSAGPTTEHNKLVVPPSGLVSEAAETGQVSESARADVPAGLGKSGSPPGSQHDGVGAPSGLSGSQHGATGLAQAQSQVNLGETKTEQLEAEIAAAGATLDTKKSAKSLINQTEEKGDDME